MYDLPARHRTLRPLMVAAVVTATAITVGLALGHAGTAHAQTVVRVASSDDLRAALANAAPGQTIDLADGTYTGSWTVTDHAATSAAPIVLTGGRHVVLRTETGRGAGLQIVDSDYWTVRGITVEHAEHGIVVESSDHVTLDGVLVHDLLDEGVHFRGSSHYGAVVGSTVTDTGQAGVGAGPGIVVGTDSTLTDTSDHVTISDDVIGPLVRGDGVRAQSGTSGGVIQRNVFDGSGLTAAASSSWVSVQGNDYQVSSNSGSHAPDAGYVVGGSLAGWGCGTVLSGNEADLSGGAAPHSTAIQVVGYDATACPTTVYDDNTVSDGGTLVTDGVPVVASFGEVTPTATAGDTASPVPSQSGASPATSPALSTSAPVATHGSTSTAKPTPKPTPKITVTVAPPATHAAAPRCTAQAWAASRVYQSGDQATFGGYLYRAQWWTQNQRPAADSWGPWERVRSC